MSNKEFDLERCKRAWDRQCHAVDNSGFFTESEALNIVRSKRKTLLDRRRSTCIRIISLALFALASSASILVWMFDGAWSVGIVIIVITLVASQGVTLVTMFELFLLNRMRHYRFRTSLMAMYAIRFRRITAFRQRFLCLFVTINEAIPVGTGFNIRWPRMAVATACLAAVVGLASLLPTIEKQPTKELAMLARNQPVPTKQSSNKQLSSDSYPAVVAAHEPGKVASVRYITDNSADVSQSECNPTQVRVICNSGDCSVEDYCQMLYENISNS